MPTDAPVVERMRAAGAIPIGRTNLPDMGLRTDTFSSLHGLTRNPWNPNRTAGGSNGGEAAALASGMSPIGLGNDIGGSLRNPASAFGIASIRPSAGRVPEAGFVPREDRLLAVQLVRRAAQALADAGYVVEEACPPRYEDAVSCYARLIISDLASVLGQLSQGMGADAMAFMNNCVQAVPPLTDAMGWSQLMGPARCTLASFQTAPAEFELGCSSADRSKFEQPPILGAMSMQKQTFAAVLVAGAILGFGAAEMIHAQVPGYATKVLMKTDLQNLPGQEAIFYASDWPSGFRLPWHVHQEGHEFVYVIEGEQTFEIEGVGTKIVKAGEIVYTPPNTPHYGRNATDKPSKTLVIRIKARDQPVMTEVKHN